MSQSWLQGFTPYPLLRELNAKRRIFAYVYTQTQWNISSLSISSKNRIKLVVPYKRNWTAAPWRKMLGVRHEIMTWIRAHYPWGHCASVGPGCHATEIEEWAIQCKRKIHSFRAGCGNKIKKYICGNFRGKMRKNTSIIRKTHWIEF